LKGSLRHIFFLFLIKVLVKLNEKVFEPNKFEFRLKRKRNGKAKTGNVSKRLNQLSRRRTRDKIGVLGEISPLSTKHPRDWELIFSFLLSFFSFFPREKWFYQNAGLSNVVI
jgi:hypothetical protein